jgi:predicted metalloprotease with PDZ domain
MIPVLAAGARWAGRTTMKAVLIVIDKLVDRGLVERQPDPLDARASRVMLTAAGSDMFDAVAPEHLANEARLVTALSAEEQQFLGRLLKTLLIEIEQPPTGRPDHRLGMTVAAATVGQQRRAAVGLPAQSGLLVEAVANNGPAAGAGVQTGDFLIASHDTPLRSLTCLERALAAHPEALPLSLHRNGRAHDIVIAAIR